MLAADMEAMGKLDELACYFKGRIRQEQEARLEAERNLAMAEAEIKRERRMMEAKAGVIGAAMLFTREAAAKALGISANTLDRLKNRGKIPHRKIGDRTVFTGGDLAAFLDSCFVPATSLPSEGERRGVAKRATGASA